MQKLSLFTATSLDGLNIFFGLIFIFVLSCDKDNLDESIKKENGVVSLSGGYAHCAEQIHLDNGVTLVVNLEDLKTLKSGDRVTVEYKETGINQFCPPYIDCEIIEIKKRK